MDSGSLLRGRNSPYTLNCFSTSRPGSQRRSRPALLLALLALVLLWFGYAPITRASPSSRVLPQAEDGEGIKVGQRSRFHPGFGLGFGFDGNVFAEDRSESPAQAAFMIATGWVGLGNREVREGMLDTPPERTNRLADYNLRLVLGFRQYLNRRPDIVRQSRFNLGTEIRLAALPGRKFSIDVNESLYRFAEPLNIKSGADHNFNRISHRGSLRFTLRPGGGRVGISAGYISEVLRFQQDDPSVNNSDRIVNGALGEIKWRFFPRSSLFTRYTFRHTYYSCCKEPGTGRNEDNYAHRLVAGYRGQVGKKVALGGEVGWGWAFYRADDDGPDFKGPIGQVSMDYFPRMRTRLHLGAFRSFNDSLFGNFFVDLGARALFSHIWRWRMVTEVGAGVMWREYRGIPQPGVEIDNVTSYSGGGDGSNRSDVLVTLLARAEQPLGRFFALALTYELTVDSTSFATTFNTGLRNDAGFVRHLLLVFGAVRF